MRVDCISHSVCLFCHLLVSFFPFVTFFHQVGFEGIEIFLCCANQMHVSFFFFFFETTEIENE